MKEGWKEVKLGKVCGILNGFAFKSRKYVDSGIRVIRIKNVQKGYVIDEAPQFYPFSAEAEIKQYLLEEGDLLMSLTGNVGRVGILPSNMLPAALNQRVACLRTKGTIDKKFLFHLLNTNAFEQLCIKNAQGVAQLNMSTEWLKEQTVLLPPLSEQHRIVEILDVAFAKIEAVKANAEKNLQNAKALFQQALAEELAPQEGWETKKLGEVCIGGLSYGSSTSAKKYDGAIRYVRITDIDDKGYLGNDYKSPNKVDNKYFLSEGDLLFARTGATVGKTYLYGESDGKCLYAGYLIRLQPNLNIINPRYLFYCTKAPDYWTFIRKAQKVTAQPNINAEQYSSYKVCFPQSISEQQRIVSVLDALSAKCYRLEEVAQRTVAECDALKQSILREAFSGNL